MQTNLSEAAKKLPRAEEAESILRSCVHCGFCNATCPTYQLLGDELDGPRGRIYLMKQMFEGGEVTEATQTHLDRCLTCRNCETTCPSGVQYHNLLDIGRDFMEQQVPRSAGERLLRTGLRTVIPRPGLFKALLGAGNTLRPLMPATLKAHMPRQVTPAKPRPQTVHARRVLILEGCVQPSLSPNTNAATARVLDRLGISGAFIKDYGHLLRNDPTYATKAARVSALTKDLVEVMRSAELERLKVETDKRMAFHCPCTLQHAQKLGGAVEDVLTRLGFHLTAVPDAHLCCGSAGSYSITQPEISHQLRDNKLNALESGKRAVTHIESIDRREHENQSHADPDRSDRHPGRRAQRSAEQRLGRNHRGR